MSTTLPVTAGSLESAPPGYRLYDPGAVGLATFFGSPIAGAILMAMNYRRLGKGDKGLLAVVLSLVATAAIIAFAMTKPAAGSSVLGIVLFVCMWQVAKATQGKAVEAHVARGGALASKWTAFWLGVLMLTMIFGTVMFILYFEQKSKTVTITGKDQVIFSGTATKADALALGNALKGLGFFDGGGATVLLDKEAGGTVISFVVANGTWNQSKTLSGFEEIAREAAPSVGGLPVQVHLVNARETVEKTSLVGEVSFNGGDGVFYEGNATQAQAQALGQQFQTQGLFTGHGANVFLIKHDDGTALSFVVADGTWNDANAVSTFETLVRNVAQAAGGLPIDMRLVTTHLVVEKDEVIK
jgi:hypothetical protein